MTNDRSGLALAYICGEGQMHFGADDRLYVDQAWRIAAAIRRLAELMGKAVRDP